MNPRIRLWNGSEKKGVGWVVRPLAQPPTRAALEEQFTPASLAEFYSRRPRSAQGVLWTNLSLRELSRRLIAMGTPASRRTIRRLLKQWKLGCRTARKKKTMGHHPDRNAQFENIARWRKEYEAAGEPIISIDTKKEEQPGNFHRPGRTYTQQTVEMFDHDFPSAGAGKLIPHGIYDVVRNHAAIHLNTSHDTGELGCDSIALWWEEHGRPPGLKPNVC